MNKKSTYGYPYVFFLILGIRNFASEQNQISHVGTRGKKQ